MSSINPNNINGSYPIAGQDNDSQGFRDNFTNVKNNLSFAKTEMEDLQNNAILKVGLSGTILDNEMNYAQLKGVQLVRSVVAFKDLGTLTTASVSFADGHYQKITTAGPLTISEFTNWSTSGLYAALRLELVIVTPSTDTVTFPGTVSEGLLSTDGAVGQTVTFDTAGSYIFEFTTYNAGAKIVISDLTRNYTFPVVTTFSNITITDTTTSTSTITGALIVAGGTGIAGNLQIGGVTVLTGNLNVTGTTALTGNVNVTGNLNVTGATVRNGNVSVTGISTLTGNLNATGTTALTGNLGVTGISTLTGNLGVTGTTALTGNVNVTGNLNVTGPSVVSGNLTITNNAVISGNLTTGGARVDAGYQYGNVVSDFSTTITSNVSRLILNPYTANTIANGTVTLPAGNVEAKVVTISSTYGITALQVNPSSGTVLKPSGNITLANGASATYFYHSSQASWYKIG